MKLQIQGSVLLEALIFSTFLLGLTATAVLSVKQKQLRDQLAHSLEWSLMVASNGQTVESTQPCDAFSKPTEIRCLLNGRNSLANGLTHRLESDGLVIEWPKIGSNKCYDKDCDNLNSVFIHLQ